MAIQRSVRGESVLRLAKKHPNALVILGIGFGVIILLSSVFLIKNLSGKKDVKKESTRSLMDKGSAQYKLGAFAEAIGQFEKLVSQKPKDPEARYKLGMAYQGAGKVNEAIKEYSEATKLNPKMTQAHYQLGIAYRTSGKDKEAIKALEESVRLSPDLGGARFMLAQLYEKADRIDDAIEQYKSLLELKLHGMNLADVHNELGLLYAKDGNIEKAKAEWNSSLKIDPNNERAKELLSEHR